MAGQICFVNGGEVALTGGVARTLLQIKAASNVRVVIHALRIFGKQPAGGADAVVKVRMTRSTANLGSGTTATPVKNNPSNGESVQTSCSGNFITEPTSPTDAGLWWDLQPQSGIIEIYPPESRIEIPGGQTVQFEAMSAGTPTLCMSATFEE